MTKQCLEWMMTEEERLVKANELFDSNQYSGALTLYAHCSLTPATSTNVNHLLQRACCYYKVKQHDKALQDLDQVLCVEPENEVALTRKIKSLQVLGRFKEASAVTKRLLIFNPKNSVARKTEENLHIIIQALDKLEDEGSDNEDAAGADSESIFLKERSIQDESIMKNGVVPSCRNESQKEDKLNQKSPLLQRESLFEDGLSSKWSYRQPPRGFTSHEYMKCPSLLSNSNCRDGINCNYAHSEEELSEWQLRFNRRRERLVLQKDQQIQYIESLLEESMQAAIPNGVMCDDIDGVKISCSENQSIVVSTKICSHSWNFEVTGEFPLYLVSLIERETIQNYSISSISVGHEKSQKVYQLSNVSYWVNSDEERGKSEYIYNIQINFKAEIFGTFRQSLVIDFGQRPVICKKICIQSKQVDAPINDSVTVLDGSQFSHTNKTIVPYSIGTNEPNERLYSLYAAPASPPDLSSAFFDSQLIVTNYKDRFHDLLYLEESVQCESISRFNVKTTLHLVDVLMPSTSVTARYAQKGHLFAEMKLHGPISDDTMHGRLILQRVNSAYICPVVKGFSSAVSSVMFEALVEDKGRDSIFFQLSQRCVEVLNLKVNTTLEAQVQFLLNRLDHCEMHAAIDRLSNLAILFPDVSTPPSIPWTPSRQFSNPLMNKLNAKQKEAVIAITCTGTNIPPLLVVGPFGTGKTYTLAQAIKILLTQEETKILICTHSNSAADLYIKDHLHPYIEEHEEALSHLKPVRLYYTERWISTVHADVLPYCKMTEDGRKFALPTLQEVLSYRIIVTTLNTSCRLAEIGVPVGHFTHILIDEAAQALECEVVSPLYLATGDTRIVLAGDPLQLSPEVVSDDAREKLFHRSMLERLDDFYPDDYPCRILLCENYRSHSHIVSYTSDLFYGGHLVAKSSATAHPAFHPLTFFTARGEEAQHPSGTSYFNNAEIYEVCDRVAEVFKKWPAQWGPAKQSSIAVFAHYSDQVHGIRYELRKRKLDGIIVERVQNVQGKEFQVVFVSTVRTRSTCSVSSNMDDQLDYGFLSNTKLLNTAITRAKSLVAVVGDPVSLCSISKCRKHWEIMIKLCSAAQSLYGISWRYLQSQLSNVEMKRYILNPLAPEFIPQRMYHPFLSMPIDQDSMGQSGQVYVPARFSYPIMRFPRANVQPPGFLPMQKMCFLSPQHKEEDKKSCEGKVLINQVGLSPQPYPYYYQPQTYSVLPQTPLWPVQPHLTFRPQSQQSVACQRLMPSPAILPQSVVSHQSSNTPHMQQMSAQAFAQTPQVQPITPRPVKLPYSAAVTSRFPLPGATQPVVSPMFKYSKVIPQSERAVLFAPFSHAKTNSLVRNGLPQIDQSSCQSPLSKIADDLKYSLQNTKVASALPLFQQNSSGLQTSSVSSPFSYLIGSQLNYSTNTQVINSTQAYSHSGSQSSQSALNSNTVKVSFSPNSFSAVDPLDNKWERSTLGHDRFTSIYPESSARQIFVATNASGITSSNTNDLLSHAINGTMEDVDDDSESDSEYYASVIPTDYNNSKGKAKDKYRNISKLPPRFQRKFSEHSRLYCGSDKLEKEKKSICNAREHTANAFDNLVSGDHSVANKNWIEVNRGKEMHFKESLNVDRLQCTPDHSVGTIVLPDMMEAANPAASQRSAQTDEIIPELPAQMLHFLDEGGEESAADTQTRTNIPLYMRGMTVHEPMSYAGALCKSSSPSTPVNSDVSSPLMPEENAPSDPLELLKKLHIKESPGQKAFYQYFA